MSLQYWYMLPLAIVISTMATASGVGGATFFAPLFILASDQAIRHLKRDAPSPEQSLP